MAQLLTDGWKAPHPHPPAQTEVSAVLLWESRAWQMGILCSVKLITPITFHHQSTFVNGSSQLAVFFFLIQQFCLQCHI